MIKHPGYQCSILFIASTIMADTTVIIAYLEKRFMENETNIVSKVNENLNARTTTLESDVSAISEKLAALEDVVKKQQEQISHNTSSVLDSKRRSYKK